MSTLDWSLQQATKTTAQIAAATTIIPLTGQIVWNTDTGKYCIGDGTTALSALTFYGGISASGLTVGTTTITGGTNTKVLYNNNGVVGEYTVTGTGSAVLNTSPIFVADITTPLIIGGSAVGSVIQYKGTSGVGTSTIAAHQFLVGNNGATTAASVYNDGTINIGNKTNTSQRLVRIGQDTSWLDFGSLSGLTSNFAIYGNQSNPGIGNAAIYGGPSSTSLNSTGNTQITVNTTLIISCTSSVITSTPQAASSGAITSLIYTIPANTNQTATTNIPNFKVTGSTKQWATGALATQYFNYFSANTVSFVGASTATHVANFRSDAPLQGTNAIATNLYAIDCGGHMFIANSVGVPSNNPTGGGILYVEAGALKYRSSNGTVTTVGPL